MRYGSWPTAFSNVAALYTGGKEIQLGVAWNVRVTPSCLGGTGALKTTNVSMRRQLFFRLSLDTKEGWRLEQRAATPATIQDSHDSRFFCQMPAGARESTMATISRPLKIIGLFCKRALSKRLYSAKETYNFKKPTKSPDVYDGWIIRGQKKS